jgi:hypothetical protein
MCGALPARNAAIAGAIASGILALVHRGDLVFGLAVENFFAIALTRSLFAPVIACHH